MGAFFLYTIHQTTECRSDFMHTYASLIVDICAKALLRGQVGSTCLPRQSLKPHDSSNNSMEWEGWFSFPAWSNTSSVPLWDKRRYGKRGYMLRGQVEWIRLKAAVTCCLMWRLTETQKRPRKHYPQWVLRLIDDRPNMFSTFSWYPNFALFIFLFPGVVLLPSPLNLVSKPFFGSLRGSS